MTLKYNTDEFGNVFSSFAQTEPVKGTICYNPEKETLDTPFEPDEGKKLFVENGKWKQIDIDINHIKENGVIRLKTQLEKYKYEIEDIPKGFKLIEQENKLELKEKTLEEKLDSNEITQEEYYKIQFNEWEIKIKNVYYIEADPLFFKSQRGEIDKQVWLNKIDEIRLRFPKPQTL